MNIMLDSCTGCEDLTRETPANMHALQSFLLVLLLYLQAHYICIFHEVICKLAPQIYVEDAVMIIPKIQWGCRFDWSNHSFKEVTVDYTISTIT